MNFKIEESMLIGARKQFCLDMGMDYEEYCKAPHKKVYIAKTKYAPDTTFPAAPGARCYTGSDAFFSAIMCLGQLFLSVDEQIYDWAWEKFSDCAPEWFCKFENLRMIDEKLKEYGREIGDTHVYYLPGKKSVEENKKGQAEGRQQRAVFSETDIKTTWQQFAFVWYNQQEIMQFKDNNRFTSAICFSPTQPDVLAVVAHLAKEMIGLDKTCEAMVAESCKCFEQNHMAGMAGVSADGEYLWQIGINVDEQYRGNGLAAELVKRLKEEIIRQGKIPFYGTSESHTISQTVALKAGFVPAWTSIYAKRV